MVSSLEELRKKLTRKGLKPVTKTCKTNLAGDHGKVVANCVASAMLFLQRLALPIRPEEVSSHAEVFSEQLKV